ncbi:protease complex subunit PrcB family protein [Clostridium sp. CF012]|uniref:protease complex subunit PrcB family protein n=1 Tax=Clostridium sp. CF012 TaxID=2843319 RepID=UPI001C0BCBE0|nr:protease complex subunit PrcB family protein [Clostridium sp. CF012]MBU3143412.1 protease complex subunit PrcB family protein [Clostridium sp. CF012]
MKKSSKIVSMIMLAILAAGAVTGCSSNLKTGSAAPAKVVTVNTVSKPVAKPIAKPIAKPVAKPIVKSVAKISEKVAPTPVKGTLPVKERKLEYTIINEESLPPDLLGLISTVRNVRGFVVIKATEGISTVRIATGEKPSGGNSIKIKSITNAKGITNIVIEEVKPAPTQFSTMQLMYPSITINIKGLLPKVQVTTVDKLVLKGISLPKTKPSNGNQGITTNILKYEIVKESSVPASIIDSVKDIRTQRGFVLIKNSDGSNLVRIATGEKASGGHGIVVKSIKDVEGITKVVIEEVKPAPTQFSTMQLMYPSIFVKVLGGTPNIEVTTVDKLILNELKPESSNPAGKINRPNIQSIESAEFISKVGNNSIKAAVEGVEMTFVSEEMDNIVSFSKVQAGDKVRLFYAEKDKGILELYEIIIIK